MSSAYDNSECCCAKPRQSIRKVWDSHPIPLDPSDPVPNDLEIARSVKGHPIAELCQQIGVSDFELHGNFKAKVKTCVPSDQPQNLRGNYVVVTGVTPTSLGEGKSTTTIGLAQALASVLGRNTFACIRQPSQGPTFGLKGGAAGGGYSQVWPMDEFNLHFTGDIHAVTAANNLIAAAIDARMFHEATQKDEDLFARLVTKPGNKGVPCFTQAQLNRLRKLGLPQDLQPDQLGLEQKRLFARLDLDPDTIQVSRVIDTNDRYLREVTVGQSPTEKGITRRTNFAISVASELMAILSLATDMADVCRRVDRMVVGFTKSTPSQPVTCEDLCVSGAVCALLKDAIYPTLIQTLEGSPVFVHCGPFANIAHGNSSIIADKLALDLVGSEGFVITEAGFASDIGFEKFVDIKCRASNLLPNCAVLVTTIRALKAHGRDLLGDKNAPDHIAIENGLINLNAHIKNVTSNFNTPVVVALNKFVGDTEAELSFVRLKAIEAGAADCRVADNWAKGGKGAAELAKSVAEICEKQRSSGKSASFLYDLDELDIEAKIRAVATKVYGASDVDIPNKVKAKIALLESNGFANLPICIAKTSMSISHDPKMKGAPSNYTFPIVDIAVSAGAGFVYALAGAISTMPGLPTRPAFFDIKLDPKTGLVDGLF